MAEINYVHKLPRFLRRGRAYTLDLTPLDGASVAVTACTYSLFDSAGVVVIDGEAATVVGGIASYSLTAVKLDGEDFGSGYIEEWTATIGGDEYIFPRSVYLVRREPRAVLGDSDLSAIHSDIVLELPAGETTWRGVRSEAFAQLLAYLIGRGHNPAEIRNLAGLRAAHLWWTIVLIAADLDTTTSGPGKWAKRHAEAKASRKEALDSLVLEFDRDEDGAVDDVEAGEPGVFLTNIPGQRRRGEGL